ncbi:DNA mismatch repair protein MutS [Trypanosoma melophagium]|uniref:DNA mismatch repair protein MutS n=1 Tax=Trypanosoma melophagium TaxID=715481 RepID=UPI00351A4E23|nr:DNA mismatch repair protein MutS [Trypanosoma melophagium]
MGDTAVDCADVYRMDFTYSFMAGIDPLRPPVSIVIPTKDLDAMGGMERQYWEIKSKYFDVLILFKKGKFYELYDMDAAIAHREFGLKLVFDSSNRGKMRLAGIPEQSFSDWARLFVFRGYKVGRVEQMKEEENSPVVVNTTRAKVVPRQLVEVLTPGTLTDPVMLSGYGTVFILALYPLLNHTVDGVAVDLSRRVAYHCPCKWEEKSRKREEDVLLMISALLQQLRPREIIFPRNFLNNNNNNNNNNATRNRKEEEGKGEKKEEDISFGNRLVDWMEGEGYRVELVDVPSEYISQEYSSETTTTKITTRSSTCAAKFLAYYFKLLKLQNAESVLSEAESYTFHLSHQESIPTSIPNKHCGIPNSSSLLWFERKEDRGLILDATTVSNLEVINNLRDGGERGSLNHLLNRCCTNGGRRLFRSWILRPSASCRVISARQEAIRFIIDHRLNETWIEGEEMEDGGSGITNTTTTTNNNTNITITTPTSSSSSTNAAVCRGNEESPSGVKRERSSNYTFEARFGSLVGVDFERNLSRLVDLKNNDNAQVAFVDPLLQYKKHLNIILTTVQAFTEMVDWSSCIQKMVPKSIVPPLLRELGAEIDAAAPAVSSIKNYFDLQDALTSGVIVPSRGISSTYDEASDRLESIEKQLNEELYRMQEEYFGGAKINFSDIGHDRFLVEVPLRDVPKKTPTGFHERSRTAKSVRYVVSAIEPLIEGHKKAKTEKSNALLNVLCSVATHICNYFPILHGATMALSYFDCLLSLASLQRRSLTTAWPKVTDDINGSYIVAEQLTHPFLNTNSVPNTVHLDAKHGRILLLTGPNMAGKSTLMRTIAVNIMIAQMGGPIFGSNMSFVPISRIFTRIGARDASHKGQSTLYVELSETADILRYADPWSLCLVDELGRGTSTHDGYAIAYATLTSLRERQPASPLVLFSTHYHGLAQEQMESNASEKISTLSSPLGSKNEHVQLGYMDFALENTEDNGVPAITFLYRLVPGICTRSYGVEVALLAGIPPALVNMASLKSLELAKMNDRHKELDTIRGFITKDKNRVKIKQEKQ